MRGILKFGLFSGLLLSSCASKPPQPGDVVAASLVINSLKCGLAKSLVDASQRSGIKGSVAVVDLTLKVVTDQTVGGSVKIEPAIVLYQGVTLGANLGGSSERKYTIDTHLKFDIKLKAASTAICKAVNNDPSRGDIGFAGWFQAILAEVDHAAAGEPLATIKGYSYDANFAVTNKENSGLDLSIIPIKISATQAYQRDDIQNIKITIDTVAQPGPHGDDGREFMPSDG